MSTKSFQQLAIAAVAAIALSTAQAEAEIILVDEDFSVDAGVVTGGNAGAGFVAGGGVGVLSGDGATTFISTGVTGIMIPEFALGGELTFQVDNLGGAANDVTRWLQIGVDGANPFSGDMFGGTNTAALLFHDDDGGAVGSQTIPAGTTSIDLLFVTTVDFGGTPLPAGEIARLGSFFAEFSPVPEPASLALIAMCSVAVLGRRRRV